MANSVLSKSIKKATQKWKPDDFVAPVFGSLPPPQKGPQELFLNTEADIALFGGSAGGGKSAGLLLDMAASDRLLIPGYSAVVFRRTCPQITNEGGLWDESSNFYPLIGGKPVGLEWQFPTGATVRFANLQHEKNIYDWQGAQVPRIGFDELTHFSESQFFYLLGRNRTTANVTPKMRATCNPDADSWVAKFIDWWIGEDGYPIPERSGVIRWFVRVNGIIEWADTREELLERFPSDDVAEVFDEDGQPIDLSRQPKSFTFIPAKLTDNPILMRKDPGYLGNLQAQHPVEQARLLHGNWKARFSSGKVFSRQWVSVVDALPAEVTRGCRTLRFWDLAATAKDVASKTSFYTASVKAIYHQPTNTLYIIDATWSQKAAGEVLQLIATVARQDGANVEVQWELEGGSSGKIVGENLRALLRGFNARAVKPMGDKLSRFVPAATLAQQGKMALLRAPWNDVYLNSLQAFDGSSQPLVNDLTDATSGVYHGLVERKIAKAGRAKW
jgi:predicted phage terminase large subunit-like protein